MTRAQVVTPPPSGPAGDAAFAGGSTELWDDFHAEPLLPDRLYFRSAPARAILDGLVTCTQPAAGQRFVELGCGGSRWLPLLARRFGVEPWGVDFSPSGIETTRALLREAGVDGQGIVAGEIREFVEAHAGRFDAVVSFGLIEHFPDLDGILADHLKCARPGGRLFVTAPNLDRVNLTWARLVAADIFTWHVPISAARVAAALERQGCRDVRWMYLGGPRMFVMPTPRGGAPPGVRQLAYLAAKGWNATGELLYRASSRLATAVAGPWLSPYFGVSALTPSAER
jgi:2-polyprenyl-3-methyl-5-hydroxy-6-metoxy-1,4-benzoquinol methylase